MPAQFWGSERDRAPRRCVATVQQQPRVKVAQLRARRRAELLAKHRPQRLIDLQGVGDVAPLAIASMSTW